MVLTFKDREFRIAGRAKDSRATSTHLYLKVSEPWPKHKLEAKLTDLKEYRAPKQKLQV